MSTAVSAPSSSSDAPPLQVEQAIEDIRIEATVPLLAPEALKAALPAGAAAQATVVAGRRMVEGILRGKDKRWLTVVGPCSIHDPQAALEYAARLVELREQVQDRIALVMRVYFEKPRTTLGWKGLINDPHLDGSFDIATGLRMARQLLAEIGEMGMPTATEMLEPVTPQYIADLVSWAAIGARTTESQTHRQMASGLSMPVGFKNSTEGNLQVAVDAMRAAHSPHSFLGIDPEGRTCIVKSQGNPFGHLILRGGRSGPNYDPASVNKAAAALVAADLPPFLVVDCSHANSGKTATGQAQVWESLLAQRTGGQQALIGAMLESNLHEGRQDLQPGTPLRYGVSVTDPCLGWEQTEALVREAHQALGA
ncbi:MAG: 3-deoxy-7-phosphoheptulonate synthase [Polyangiales bacterium]